MQGGYSSINLSSSRYACSILSLTGEFYGNVRFCQPFALILANPVGWKIFDAEGLWHSFARGAWKAGLKGSVGSLQLKWVDTDFPLECWYDSYDIFLNSGQWWSITSCSPSVGPLEKCLGSVGFLPQGFAAEVSFPRMCHTPVDSTCLSNCRDGVGILEFWMGQWSKSDVRAKRWEIDKHLNMV